MVFVVTMAQSRLMISRSALPTRDLGTRLTMALQFTFLLLLYWYKPGQVFSFLLGQKHDDTLPGNSLKAGKGISKNKTM